MDNYFFEVLRPGINTTFQDKGRFHMQHLGVTPGGCMDLDSFLIANALVGNSSNEGVLEFAYQGPLLKLIKGKTKIAITGNVIFQIIKSNEETKQLGFIIPKKIVKKSSSRNLIKRWTRELVKTNEKLSKAILVVRNFPDLSTKKNKQDIYKELKLLISLVT